MAALMRWRTASAVPTLSLVADQTRMAPTTDSPRAATNNPQSVRA